jgi:two-component system LytT family response regulator
MIKALLIDDEPLARSIVREYLQDHQDVVILQECSDGFEGIKAIQQTEPDLIFLDIQMPKISGFEMLELLEQPPAVIFTTAFDEYAIKAFESNAVDYLLKPFSKERFDKALEKFMDQQQLVLQKQNTRQLLQSYSSPETERIVVKTAGKIKIIGLKEIMYLEAADDYVKVHTREGAFLKNKTLSYFEQSLDQRQFVRTHRSYLVNISEITRIDPYEKENHQAILRSGARVPVSRSGYPRLRAILGL